jgi:predicted nucleic acid-binding protein
MQVLDASSVIYAWDNYPIEQFPPLWRWLADEVKGSSLAIPTVAFDEVEHKTPDCGIWLKGHNVQRLKISNDILKNALSIKALLKIVGEQYHPKGVGENDILIIATAQAHGANLISDEAQQKNPPDAMSKRKIPSVCGLPEVGVPCVNFLEFIKRSKVVFE